MLLLLLLITKKCLTACDPVDCSPLGSSSMEFPWLERWSGLPFPSPGDLPNPGIKPKSPATPDLQVDSIAEPLRNVYLWFYMFFYMWFYMWFYMFTCG